MYCILWVHEGKLFLECFKYEFQLGNYYNFSMDEKTLKWIDKLSLSMIKELEKNKVSVQYHS